MAAREAMPGHLLHFLSPKSHDIEQLADRTLSSPQRQQWNGGLAAAVSLYLFDINRSGGSIIFADCMDAFGGRYSSEGIQKCCRRKLFCGLSNRQR